MTASLPETALSSKTALGWLALVLLVAFGLRYAAIQADGLWMDEIFGASYVNLNPLELVVAVLRFDIHPPGYYLQLSLWSLVSKDDQWLLLNSVFWSLASIVVVYLGVAARAGRAAALVGAALTAVLGSEIFFASELRMYSALACHVLLLWYSVDQWLFRERPGYLYLVGALVLSLSMLHSIAFIAVGSVLCYAWMQSLLLKGRSLAIKPLLMLTAVSGALLLPWLINASFRSVTHARVPSLDNVAQTVGGWWLGYFPGLTTSQYIVAASLVGVLVAGLMWRGSPYVRALLFSFVIAPVLLVALVSVVLRPIWLDRTLAYAAPFLTVALAVHLQERLGAGRRVLAWGAAVLAVYLALFIGYGSALERIQISRKMQFREAAQHLARVNTARHDIYAPSNVRFWAMARYLDGPAWGSLLAIQDPVKVDDSDTWRRIYAKLGDSNLQRLHLKPSQRYLDTPHGRIWVGYSPLPPEVVSGGYYYVGDMNDRDKAQACPFGAEVSRQRFEGVMVFECKRP